MQRLAVATDVHVSPETAFEFLVDFPRYAHYSDHLSEVRSHGDGGPGTEYDLRFAWWRLGYTVRSRVTGIEPPDRIDWRLVDGLAARGHWEIEPLDGSDGPDPADPASRVTFVAAYDPDSLENDRLRLPTLLSIDGLVDRVTPRIRAEAERVVERVVADLEGEAREVDLDVLERPGDG